MINVVTRLKIGVEADQQEFDIEWNLTTNPPASSIKRRSFRRVAYAIIAGPDDILLQFTNDINACVAMVVKDIGLSEVIRDPIAASNTLRSQALANCLGHIIEDDYANLSIAVSVLVDADSWQQC